MAYHAWAGQKPGKEKQYCTCGNQQMPYGGRTRGDSIRYPHEN